MATNRPTRTTAYTIMGEIAAKRKTMVSTGDRSAKIRTYNYPPPRPHHRPPHQLHHLQPARLYEWRHSGLHRPPDCGRKCREAQRERVGLVQHSASLFNRNSWDINTKRPLPLGVSFFGGELNFTAKFVYIQHIRWLCCETTLLTKTA